MDGERDAEVARLEAMKNGAAPVAATSSAPLFARYPDVYAVQDLRCQLALLERFDADRTKAECASMARLSAHGR